MWKQERRYSKRELFTRDLVKLLQYCHSKGYGVTLGEAYRTIEQQEIHRKARRSKVKVSQHQKRLATDLYIWNSYNGRTEITDEQWHDIGMFWINLDNQNRWGGNYGIPKPERGTRLGWDRWHFERRG